MNKISKDTIIRTVILAVALLNQILTATGKNPLPFSENEIYTIISSLATTAAALWAWWKNNSFTVPAIIADKYLNELKAAKTKTESGDKQ